MIQEAKDFLGSRQKVNLCMVALNLVIYLLMFVEESIFKTDSILVLGTLYLPALMQGQIWRMVTSMFIHFGLTHLVYNMMCLLTLGDMLEQIVGKGLYLLVYFASGIAGGALSVVWELHTGRYAVSAGASGAIFGVIGALVAIALFFSKRAGEKVFQKRPGSIRERIRSGQIIPDSFTGRLVMMSILMAAQGFFEKGTNNAAHIGGMVAGFLIGLLICAVKRRGTSRHPDIEEE